MEDDISSSLNVMDFIIAVLRQHEKSLDESLARLESTLRQMKKGEVHKTTKGKTPKRRSKFPLREIERVILNLSLRGETVDEIAARLATSPLHVKEIIEGLTRKGYLPPEEI